MMQTILTSETHTLSYSASFLQKKIIHQQTFTVVTLVTLVGGTTTCTDNVCGHSLLLWDLSCT